MAATPLPPFEPAAVARFLAEHGNARDVALRGCFDLLPGGAIKENWGFCARIVGGPLDGEHDLVLRKDAPTGIAASLSPSVEFAVLRAAYGAGVAVPEPLFDCPDPAILGEPFFVMRRLAGTAQGRQITADPALEPALPAIARRLAEELVRLQTIRPPCADLAFLPQIGPAEHIAAFRAYLDRHPNPRPVLEWAIRWLERHAPEPLDPVLCHRDFRTGNYLVDGGQLTGVLDWEFAGWGDPDEDIGWLCCKGWRFARLDRELGGIAARAPFYQAYECASGRRLDPARIFFWEVLANVRWATIALQQSDRYLLGGARNLATAIIGRRASECDLELLILLDPLGAPQRGSLHAPTPQPAAARGGRRSPRRRRTGGGNPCGEDRLRDLPSGSELLALARELLLGELLPLLPPEREREVRLVATAMTIAEREAGARDGRMHDIAALLAAFYGPSDVFSLGRFAGDLRTGAFEACETRGQAARALLWRMTMLKLREGNPAFLVANGFGA
jgi:aminoglycoside phosphotransferase (APT) family kinase protein